MPGLNTLQQSKTSSVLIYGPPKCGKTQLAGELASHFNLKWFDLENGHDTLFKLPQEAQERIMLYTIPDTRDVPMAIETCLKVMKGGACKICVAHGKVNCPKCQQNPATPSDEFDLTAMGPQDIVVFDSLTQLTNSAIANITKNQPDDYKLNFDDWANLGKLMDTFLSRVQQAKRNIICISHETEVELEDGTIKVVPTAGSRNFSRNTAKYFDHVIYCTVKNKKHAFGSSTTFSNSILTGSRADIVLEKMELPSLLPIFQRSSAAPASRVELEKQAEQQTAATATKNLTAQHDRLAALRAKTATTATTVAGENK